MKILLILFIACSITSFSPTAFGQNEWKTYENARFDYSISYPSDLLAPEGEADNGDGQVFTGEGGEMRVYGSHLLLNETLLKEFNAVVRESGNVSYKIYRKNYFVVSGVQNKKIFYRKTTAKGDAFITLLIEYDESKRAAYDKIVTKIAGSFR